jgi:DNA-binding MarR family transcriptional regulator
MGLIVKKLDEMDARIKRLWLTPKGHQTITQIKELVYDT